MGRYILLTILLMMSTVAFAQSSQQDVVYLKNGSVIRGTIIEIIPNETIRIQTADFSIFVYRMEEVEKIIRETAPNRNNTNNTFENRRGYIGISIGPSIPIGDYSDVAKVGATLNLIDFGYLFTDNIGITARWFSSANASEFDVGNWLHGGILAGPLFSLLINGNNQLDFRATLGYSVSSIEISGESLDGTSFAYGLGFNYRLAVGDRLAMMINADFLSANTELSFNTGFFGTFDIDQEVRMISLGIGVAYRLR